MPIAIADLSESLSNVVERTGKSVVRVEGRHPVSGVVWSPKQIVTVAHALAGDTAEVTVEGKTLAARENELKSEAERAIAEARSAHQDALDSVREEHARAALALERKHADE